ncbi:MAG: hypothetical protein ACE5MM_03560, partial [Nitrospiraceae bacterium]
MIPLATLKKTVQRTVRQLARQKDILDAEVFASSTGELICRLNYTSHIPCHGVEEPKSSDSFGIGIRAVFKGPEIPLVGFGSEARDLSPVGIRRALEKARANAMPDPHFVSLPTRVTSPPRRSRRELDRAIMELNERKLVEAGWRVINEALKAFASSDQLVGLAGTKEKLASLGLIVGGDVSLMRQRVAIGSTLIP